MVHTLFLQEDTTPPEDSIIDRTFMQPLRLVDLWDFWEVILEVFR